MRFNGVLLAVTLLSTLVAPVVGAQDAPPCRPGYGFQPTEGVLGNWLVTVDPDANTSVDPGANLSVVWPAAGDVAPSATDLEVNTSARWPAVFVCYRLDVAPGSGYTAYPRAPPAPLTLANIQVLWSSPDELTVIWSANYETIGRLWWGPRGGPPTNLLETLEFAPQHSAVLKGLVPTEWYAVQVAVIDRSSHFVESAEIFVKHDVGTRLESGTNALAALATGLTAGAAVALIRIRTVHRP